MPVTLKPVSLTASTTLVRNVHKDVPISLDKSGGLTVTLPASSGSGDKYKISVGTALTTSNYVIQVANSTDVMAGIANLGSTGTSGTFSTTASSDTITMNGGTTGGGVGSYVELEDYKSGFWRVTGNIYATGTAATPFSAAV
jgi:hypothetical protein